MRDFGFLRQLPMEVEPNTTRLVFEFHGSNGRNHKEVDTAGQSLEIATSLQPWTDVDS